MKISPKKHFVLQLLLLGALFLLYTAVFFAQRGAPVKAEWWVRDVLICKEEVAKTFSPDKKKIIVIAGSNVLLSLDSKLMSQLVGIPVLNLATHGALEISFYRRLLEQHYNPGDIVILPLEASHYFRTSLYSDWFVNNILAWGAAYFDDLSPLEQLEFMFHTPPERVLDGVLAAFSEDSKLKDADNIRTLFRKNTGDQKPNHFRYSYQWLNRQGEFIVDLPPTRRVRNLQRGKDYPYGRGSISDHFLSEYEKIQDLVSKHDGRLILTWPIMLRNPRFDLEKARDQAKVDAFVDDLKKCDIDILYPAALFQFGFHFFYDTESHANRKGAILRTVNLAACVSQDLHGQDWGLDWDEALDVVKVEELAVAPLLKQDKYPLFAMRYYDFRSIRKALQAYKEKYGSYPVSSGGWDGVKTLWGKEGKDWIPGLVPEFLPALPRDPRGNDNPTEQYLYKSDGIDYKLLAHRAEDSFAVRQVLPSLADPRRELAYGIWTSGAAHW
ncbi:hypothetical protein DPQ33_08915 [Oceanidesulfovibrio indonesiensis]|uniref:Uncharacterized protein n=1 Tax=Oceanidesulfovibrio indonesiensis TaxID=54767 RepID=A0A7M3MF93_9BACT|nr:hypothetical protein [Oceanidesulfovibrio indonesiensis]TVM17297.1 hypothetical protein DPQ33_08915 [Oceanidesulfovibrio indonesiensis]